MSEFSTKELIVSSIALLTSGGFKTVNEQSCESRTVATATPKIWIRMFVLAVGAIALWSANIGSDGSAQAATMTESEPKFVVPGTTHRDKGRPLHARSAAGMPATVANFLTSRGRGVATINSMRAERQLRGGSAGATVIDYGQVVQGLTVYGVRAKAIFNRDDDLVTLQENLVQAGPIAGAGITFRVALAVALARVHPNLNPALTESSRSANSVRYGGDTFFYKDPRVTKVAIPGSDGSLAEGYLVETWSDAGNQLYHTLIDGSGRVLQVQNRTANDSFKVFRLNPNVTLQIDEDGALLNDPFSPDTWLDAGSQRTTFIAGNNVRAYLDINGNDAPDTGGSVVADGNFLTVFDRLEDPTTSGNRAVAVQNLFYLNNIIHDELYFYGFTEEWRNFQQFNFGPDGIDGDAVQAEAQDGAGTNNANFATPPDGVEPRMQMFLWDGVVGGGIFLNYAYAANLVIGEFDGSNEVDEHYLAADALFGPALDDTGITAAIVYIGSNGCIAGPGGPDDFMHGVDVNGKIVLMDRGCAFTTKAINAQDAGAVAVIVANNPSQGDDLVQMNGDPVQGALVTIPIVLVGTTDGAKLKALATPPVGVGTTLRSNPADSRDGDLDVDIVRHEYGHGLSWRLVGNMDGIMGGALGEGIGDAYAAIMTNDDRIGEYSFANTVGLRKAPYGNWKVDTGRVYESFVGQVHDDGEIYAAILWDMWERYRDDTSGGVTGPLEDRQDEIMTDIVGGMQLTLHQCDQPTFRTMRNGILEAIGGTADPDGTPVNQERWCHAWRAFAKHGVGADEYTNCSIEITVIPFPPFEIPTVTWTWIDGFDVPAQCNNLGDAPGANIALPSDGHSESQGQNIDFVGTASDTEDGDLSSEIFWMSNINGEFGRGASVSTAGLGDGTHTITASVTDADGNSASDSITVTVTTTNPANKPPIGDFTFTTSGLNVNFTDTSTDSDGTIASWSWDFGDGNSSTAQNPSHGYATAGIYSVELTVTDDDGAETITSRTVIVADGPSNTAPTANAGPDQNVGDSDLLPGDSVTLDGSGSSDSDGTVASYAWTWTGGSDTGVSPTVSLPDGTTVVSLIVTDDDGAASVADTVSITVEAPSGNVLPVADAGDDQSEPAVGKGKNASASITLNGSLSYDTDGTITDYDWTWAGGDPASGIGPIISLPKGTHVITLTVSDSGGGTDSNTVCIEVYNKNPAGTCVGLDPAPTAGFTYSATMLDVGFTDTSTDSDGSVVAWAWDSGDGSPLSSAQNPSHLYAVAGDYTVMLTVTDNDGNTDMTAQTVSVSDVPGGDITLSANGYKVKGKHTVDLTWSGNSGNVDILRNGVQIIGGGNVGSGAFTDNTGNKGSASYDYEVCETGTNDCSNVVNVTL